MSAWTKQFCSYNIGFISALIQIRNWRIRLPMLKENNQA